MKKRYILFLICIYTFSCSGQNIISKDIELIRVLNVKALDMKCMYELNLTTMIGNCKCISNEVKLDSCNIDFKIPKTLNLKKFVKFSKNLKEKYSFSGVDGQFLKFKIIHRSSTKEIILNNFQEMKVYRNRNLKQIKEIYSFMNRNRCM